MPWVKWEFGTCSNLLRKKNRKFELDEEETLSLQEPITQREGQISHYQAYFTTLKVERSEMVSMLGF